MLIRRTPLTQRSRPLRRLTPLRPVSDRMLTMDPAVVHAREQVEERDGSCILRGKPGVDAHHRLPRGGEELSGIRPGSPCPVWSGCAVTTTCG
jgi:hypothetical protein